MNANTSRQNNLEKVAKLVVGMNPQSVNHLSLTETTINSLAQEVRRQLLCCDSKEAAVSALCVELLVQVLSSFRALTRASSKY